MDNNTEVSIKFKNSVTGQKKLEQYAATLKQVHSFLGAIDTNKSKEIDKNTRTTTTNSSKLAKNFNTAFEVGKIALFANQLKRLVQTSTQLIKKSAEYTENLNLLSVAFYEEGRAIEDTTNEAMKFVNTLSDMYGLDESRLIRVTGLFKQMANSLGISNEAGTELSQTLTQLSIDAASLFNAEEVEDAAKVFQSALASQTKPVRGFTGADITQQTLQVTLDTYGIDRAITDLSYAEKRLVIVASLVDQLEQATGDFGRTIESPANQLRIFTEQIHRLARAIGNVLMPIFAKVIPYINAFVMVLVELVNMFANFVAKLFGYDFEQTNPFASFDEGVVEFGNDVDETSAKVKKLKSGLRGFDKLNVISSNPSSGGAGGGGGKGGVDPKIYDLLNQATEKYNEKLERTKMLATTIRNKIMEWLGFTELTDEEGNHLGFTFEKITGGTILGALAVGGLIFVGVAGIVKMFKKITGMFGKKTEKGTVGDMLGGGTASKTNWQSLSDGLGKMFKSLGTAAVIIATLGGIALVLKEITGLFKTLSESGYEANDVLLIMGSVMGSVSVLVLALAAAAKLLSSPIALGALILVVGGISAILLVMKETLPTILEHVGKFITEIAPSVDMILQTILTAIKEIIYALGETLPPIIDSIGRLFEKVFNGISKVIRTVGNVVVDILETIDTTVNNVLKGILNFINKLGPAINRFVDEAIKAVTKLINFLISGIEYMINTLVIDSINAFLETLNKIPGVDFDPLKRVEIERFRPRLKIGMDFVPSDNFPAYLDYGERVLTRQENEDYNRGIIRGENAVTGSPVNATFVIQVGDKQIAKTVLSDIQEMARSNGKPIQIGA